MTHTEDARRVGDALAAAVTEDIEARGLRGQAKVDAWIQEYTRRAKGLDQARIPVQPRRAPDDYVPPMERVIENPAPWESRRARDNVIGEQAAANLVRRSPDGRYTADQFNAEMVRLEAGTGHRYRDDPPPYSPTFEGGEAA